MDDEPMWAADLVVALTPNFAFTIPETVNEFTIKDNHLTLIKGNQFDGRTKTDPHKHIHEFIRIYDMLKYKDTENEAIHLIMFPLSITREVKTWLDELNEGTIKTWDELRTAFISRFFPPALFDRLLEEIRAFSQHENESLTDARLRMKEMLRNFHGHNLSKGNIIKIFYHGLNEITLKILNAAAGDAQYKDFQSRSKQSNLDDDDIPMSCEEEAKFMQTFRHTRSYNDYRDRDSNRDNWHSSGRNNYNRDNCQSHFDDKPDLQKQLSDFIKAYHSTNYFVKDTFIDLKNKLQTTTKNHQVSIQNLKAKFDRFADKQSGQPFRSLPSNTQPNPKGISSKPYQPPQAQSEHVNTIFTKSGKSFDLPVKPNDHQNNFETPINFDRDDEDDEHTPQPKPKNPKPVKETPTPKPYKPKVLYTQRLRKEKMEAQYGKFLKMIHAIQIDVPLIDVLAGMPNYGKILKELVNNKHKIIQILATFLSDETKNMLVEVGKFTFPVDFVILEMEKESKVPLILGRTFLHIVNAVIRVKQKPLNLGVGTERMIFNIDCAIKHSYLNDDTCFSIDVIDEILEEDFDDLLDKGKSVKVFIDDFFVFGSSFDHWLNNLNKMLQRCEDVHLVLNWEKCHFMVKEGFVLGHTVSEAGLKVDKEKINVISKLLPPTNIKVFAFDQFRSHLVLSKTSVHTDLSALRHLFKKQDAKPLLIRWILLLQEFDIEIKDRKGTKNVTADHLSTIEKEETSDDSEVDDNFLEGTLMEINTKDYPWFADFANYLVSDIIPKGTTYQQMKKFFSDIKHYFWEEPYLFNLWKHINPLTTQQERKTRKDYGTRRGHSFTPYSSTFGQPSSSHLNDDGNDGNDEGTSRASTHSLTRFVNSLKNEPLPTDTSPTALLPGYIDNSNPEEDDEDPEEDPVDYHANGGDNDDNKSSDDDDDDDVEKEGEVDEEEEHLALETMTTVNQGMSVEEIERVVAQRVANAIEAIAIYETKTNLACKSMSQTERQKEKVEENANNKRKWEGNHNGSSSQQNKGHKVPRAHTAWPINKKAYDGSLPLCN
nr:reverse transcriptase domain-containing protein [Tanacetum cinerariifolium]